MRSTATGTCTSEHAVPTEEALRFLWRTQQFSHNGLQTEQGCAVTILCAGVQNEDAGPDFAGARIRIGPTTYVGDIELHLTPRHWFSHKHHRDPHYNGVILHVVLDPDCSVAATQTACKRSVPVLVLRPYLDPAAVQTLSRVSQKAPLFKAPVVRCVPWNHHIPSETIRGWIDTLYLRRIDAAVHRAQERLYELIDSDEHDAAHEPLHHYHGCPDDIPVPTRSYEGRVLSRHNYWNQLFYEAIMEGVGFTKNRDPFHRLAQYLPLHALHRYPLADLDTQLALMLGTAGLLPSSRGLPDLQSRIEVRKLRRLWNDLRHTLHRPTLHEAEWLFFRLRPANFPTARIAAVCHLLPACFGPGQGFEMILHEMKNRNLSPAVHLKHLHDRMHIEPAGFWRTHTHFRGRRPVQGIALGAARCNQIIVNGIVPLLLLWSRLFGDNDLTNITMMMVECIPASQSRTVQTMNECVVKQRFPAGSALTEQGLLECYSRYCVRGRCSECGVGLAVERMIQDFRS